MRRILLSVGVLLSLASALQAQASRETARELVQKCEEVDRHTNLVRAGYCLGYFSAVLVTHQIYRMLFDRFQLTTRFTADGRARVLLCFPEGVTVEEVMRVFLKYMRDHPEKLHENADLTVVDALMGAFPCKP